MVKYGVHYDGTRSFIVKVDDSRSIIMQLCNTFPQAMTLVKYIASNLQVCATLPQAKDEMIKTIDADIEHYGEMIRMLREKRAYFENLEEGDL